MKIVYQNRWEVSTTWLEFSFFFSYLKAVFRICPLPSMLVWFCILLPRDVTVALCSRYPNDSTRFLENQTR